MTLSLTRIRAVNAVATTGSFAGAARLLGISQPAVSQHIKGMEEEYGVRLFQRRNGLFHPTPLCSELCDVAERMAEAENAATRILNRQNTLLNGRISIGLGNSMPGMALIALFNKRHPGIAISVETGSFEEITRAVITRRVDVGVLPNVPDDGRFRRELLVRQHVVAIVHPQSELAAQENLTCEQLMLAPLIFRTRGSSTQRVVDKAFHAAGLDPAPLLTLDTRDGVYEAVANGMGVGFMWREGTGRTDKIRRIPVREMNRLYDEVAFMPQDEDGLLTQAFFATARAFRLSAEIG
ncbi:MAG: LysR substrate-binding domain-containing protein [Oricola sp.]